MINDDGDSDDDNEKINEGMGGGGEGGWQEGNVTGYDEPHKIPQTIKGEWRSLQSGC